MSNEQKYEIIKALAYGRTAEEIVDAEGVTYQDVLNIQFQNGPAIAEARAELEKGGFIDGAAE